MSVELTNEQAIRMWKRRHTIRKRLKSNKAKAKRLNDSMQRDYEYLFGLDNDDFEIYRGVLIDDTWGDRISPVSREIEREGHLWLNAHNQETYGFSLRWYEDYTWKDEFMGSSWPNKEQVIKIIKNWIVLGTVPRSVPWRKGQRVSTYNIDNYLRRKEHEHRTAQADT